MLTTLQLEAYLISYRETGKLLSLTPAVVSGCPSGGTVLHAVTMCTNFCSYFRGMQFTLLTDHRLLRWLQRFRNSNGMLARWYMLLRQFSVTCEYRPWAQHANADGLSRTGETWVAATHLDEVTGDLPPSGPEPDLITASLIRASWMDSTLMTARMGPDWCVSVLVGLCRAIPGTSFMAFTI